MILFSVLLLAWGCGDLLYHEAAPAPEPGFLVVQYAQGIEASANTEGLVSAFSRVDAVHIRLVRAGDGEVVFDGVLAATPRDGEVRVQIEVDLEPESRSFGMELELRRGTDALFRSGAELTLQAGGVARPQLELEPVPAGVEVEPATPEALRSLGERVQLTGFVTFATGDVIPGRVPTWRSLDPAVVSVSEGGEVTAVSAGSGRVEAAYAGVTREVTVRVEPAPATIEIEPAGPAVQLGTTQQLSAVVRDAGGSPIEGTFDPPLVWSSDDATVASVSQEGVVTGVTPGEATIEARIGDVAGSTEVTVIAVPPSVETLEADETGSTGGRLRGSVNPSGLETRAWFEWGQSATLSSPNLTPDISLSASISSSSVTHSLEDLAPGRTYYYRVAAENEAGTTRGSILSFATHLPAPTALELDLNGYPVAYWSYDTGTHPDATFEVQVRRISPEGDWEVAGHSQTTSLEFDRLLTADVTYGVRVRACRAGSCSDWSATLEVTPEGYSPFAVRRPAIDMGGTSATLRTRLFDGGHDTEYRFEWANNSDMVGTQFTPWRSAARTAFTGTEAESSEGLEQVHHIEEFLTDLQPGATYYYRALAENPDGTTQSQVSSFTVGSVPPPIRDLTVTQSQYGGVEISWGFAGSPQFFEVERRVGSGGTWQFLMDSSGSTAWDFPEPGVEHGYRVRACSYESGCSNLSDPVFYTLPEASEEDP